MGMGWAAMSFVAAWAMDSHAKSHQLSQSHIKPHSKFQCSARTFERRMGTSGLSGPGNGCLSVRGQVGWESRLSYVMVCRYVQDLRIIPKSCKHGQGMKVCQGVWWSVLGHSTKTHHISNRWASARRGPGSCRGALDRSDSTCWRGKFHVTCLHFPAKASCGV